jgi:AAA domain
MKFLEKASKGVLMRPQVMVIYGPNGCGKTTLASEFENPVIVDLENGSGFLSKVSRIEAKDIPDYAALKAVITEILTEAHDFKTLVIDSLESLEALLSTYICKKEAVTSIEAIPYGKGYIYMREEIEALMRLLQSVRDKRQMNIVLVGHAAVKVFNDPSKNVSFDRYQLRLNEKCAAVVKDLADSIYFVTYRFDTRQDKGDKKAKAFGTSERVIFTEWQPAYDAKSRYPVPFEVPYTLDNVKATIQALKPKDATSVLEECEHLVKQIRDKKLSSEIAKYISDAASDPVKLEAIKNRLIELTK